MLKVVGSRSASRATLGCWATSRDFFGVFARRGRKSSHSQLFLSKVSLPKIVWEYMSRHFRNTISMGRWSWVSPELRRVHARLSWASPPPSPVFPAPPRSLASFPRGPFSTGVPALFVGSDAAAQRIAFFSSRPRVSRPRARRHRRSVTKSFDCLVLVHAEKIGRVIHGVIREAPFREGRRQQFFSRLVVPSCARCALNSIQAKPSQVVRIFHGRSSNCRFFLGLAWLGVAWVAMKHTRRHVHVRTVRCACSQAKPIQAKPRHATPSHPRWAVSRRRVVRSTRVQRVVRAAPWTFSLSQSFLFS